MRPFYALCASAFISLAVAIPAQAGNIANCEVVLMKTIPDESGNGGMQVASYRPAAEFIASVYNEDMDTLYEIDGEAIQAIMCRRMDIIPSETDFKLLATGIPFFVSQSFESADTDLISVFFKEGEFRYNYKGPGLSEEAQTLLDERMREFNEKEHDLHAKETKKKKSRRKQAKEKGTKKKGAKKKRAKENDTQKKEVVDANTDTSAMTAIEDISHTEHGPEGVLSEKGIENKPPMAANATEDQVDGLDVNETKDVEDSGDFKDIGDVKETLRIEETVESLTSETELHNEENPLLEAPALHSSTEENAAPLEDKKKSD